MTAQTITETVIERLESDDDSMYHITVCHNDDVSLCGLDLSRHTFRAHRPDDFDCAVCFELDEMQSCHPECVCSCCRIGEAS